MFFWFFFPILPTDVSEVGEEMQGGAFHAQTPVRKRNADPETFAEHFH